MERQIKDLLRAKEFALSLDRGSVRRLEGTHFSGYKTWGGEVYVLADEFVFRNKKSLRVR